MKSLVLFIYSFIQELFPKHFLPDILLGSGDMMVTKKLWKWAEI